MLEYAYACIIFILAVVAFHTIFNYSIFYELFLIIKSHYDCCPVFSQPPGFIHSPVTNTVFGKHRVNALVTQYFLFLLATGFLILSFFWYATYRIHDLTGIQVNSTAEYLFSSSIRYLSVEMFLIILAVPIIAVNPIFDIAFVTALHKNLQYDQSFSHAPATWQIALKFIEYADFRSWCKRIFVGFIPVYLYYISFKLALIALLGTELINEVWAAESRWVALILSIAFMTSCRAVALQEMYS